MGTLRVTSEMPSGGGYGKGLLMWYPLKGLVKPFANKNAIKHENKEHPLPRISQKPQGPPPLGNLNTLHL